MHRSNHRVFTDNMQILLDVLCLLFSYVAAQVSVTARYPEASETQPFWMLAVYLPLFVLMMSNQDMYDRSTFHYWDRVLRSILVSAFMGAIACFVVLVFVLESPFVHHVYGRFMVMAPVLTWGQRTLMVGWLHRNRSRWANRAILVGTPEMIKRYNYYMDKTAFRLNLIGCIPVNSEDGADCDGIACIGEIEHLDEVIRASIVDEVVFALPRHYTGQIEPYVQICEQRGITVKIALDLFDLKISKTFVHSVGTLPILTYHTVWLSNTQLVLKRLLDIVGASIGILLTVVVSVVLVPAILLDSPGPVLFRQERVGRYGRIFKLYKFRSMCADAEARKRELQQQNTIKDGMMFKIEKDPRITRVGAFIRRTSLDELPQFINVLMGDMSLVGTRPPTIDEVDKYKDRHHRRISIKPGITGLWQISGRSEIKDFDEVLRLDTRYIDNWTIWSDLLILSKTIHMLLFRRKGAY